MEGLIGLTGLSIASLIALRLNSQKKEGFNVIPNEKDKYPQSIEESQSRYNQLTNMINPLINGLIPVGTNINTVNSTRTKASKAFGSQDVNYQHNVSQTLGLNPVKNKYIPRADNDKSVFAAINFCKNTGKLDNPFGTPFKDGLIFDDVCGVCLTGGVDENGNTFTGQQGLVLDKNTKQQAYDEQIKKGIPFPQVGPSLALCNGAPNTPVFATNANDLIKFKKRLECSKKQQIDPAHECGLCFENNTYSFVSKDVQIMGIKLFLQGIGNANITVKNKQVGTVTLNNTSAQSVDLTDVKEGDIFGISVNGTGGTVYGYLQSTNPNGGLFQMPLNLLLLVDDSTGNKPSLAGGFYTFSSLNMQVAKIKYGPRKSSMSLRGTIPFTFVDPDDFSAYDCPAAPYQTSVDSVNKFSTDQVCFTKTSRPGNYSTACLQSVILNAGCTNGGSLYKNPSSLNNINGVAQTISQIYDTISSIASNDMVETAPTLQCSGRDISTPCDTFLARPDLKFTNSVQGAKCIAYLYNNIGADQSKPNNIGPTYSGLVTYANKTKSAQNIYCLPEGTLNPNTNPDSLTILSNLADNGFNKLFGIDAVKSYLNSQLEIAVDMTRNANTDVERRSAIGRCFGKNLSNLPRESTQQPLIRQSGCGSFARYVRIKPNDTVERWIQIAQLVVIDKTGTNVALNKPTTSSGSLSGNNNDGPQNAVDGTMSPRNYPNMYHSELNTTPASSYWMVDLGEEYDITSIIYYNRIDCCSIRAKGMKIQLLDSYKNIVDEKILPSGDQIITVSFAIAGAPATCKTSLYIPPPPIPSGPSRPGLYLRHYKMLSHMPNINTFAGWGDRFLSSDAYVKINKNPWALWTEHFGFIAKGYYVAQKAEKLNLWISSDDGSAVFFNNKLVIGDNWFEHGDRLSQTSIDIYTPGVYPIEIKFYQWIGGNSCQFWWSVDDNARTDDLSERFVYYPQEVNQEEQLYQNSLRANSTPTKPDYLGYVNYYSDILDCYKSKCWLGYNGITTTSSKSDFGETHYRLYGKTEGRILPLIPS